MCGKLHHPALAGLGALDRALLYRVLAPDIDNAVVGHHLWPWTSGLCWTARAVYVTSPNDGHTAQQRLVVPEPSTITRCDSRRGFGALAQLRSRPVQAGSACLTDFGLIAAASRSVGLADAVVWGWSSACVSAKVCPRREQGRRRRSLVRQISEFE